MLLLFVFVVVVVCLFGVVLGFCLFVWDFFPSHCVIMELGNFYSLSLEVQGTMIRCSHCPVVCSP